MSHELTITNATPLGGLRFDRGQQIVLVGLVCNIALAGLQLFAGWYGHSRAVLADGIHSSSDILISLLVLGSLRIARRPADPSHPFGHDKAESIAAFVIGLTIAAAGLSLAYEMVTAILGGTEMVPGMLPMFVAGGSIVVKAILYRVTIGMGRQLNSPGVLAAALEYRSCVAISSAALAGIIGAWLGLPLADSLAGLLVAGFVLKMAGKILWTSTNELMDAALPAESVEMIRAAAREIEGVRDVPDVRTRQMGSKRLVVIEISTAPDLVVEEADQLATQVQKRIVEELEEADQVQVFISSTGQARISRQEREGVVHQLIQQQARRFVSSEGLRITRLGRDVCADFTLVLPQAEAVEKAYALCVDLEREIKARFPDMEVIIRLRATRSQAH